MKIAFLFIAEAYQTYHGASVAMELAQRSGWDVTAYYHDPATPAEIERIRQAFGFQPLDCRPMRQRLRTRLLKRFLGRFSLFKKTVMRDNAAELNGYDAIVAQENSGIALRDLGVDRPLMIYLPHGFGDRAVSFLPRIARFDFVTVAGPKTERRMLERGLIRPGHYALTGVVKLEVAARLGARWEAPLDMRLPTVLYNPHREFTLTSWHRFLNPLLRGFDEDRSMNLIVAPHIKMYNRRTERERAALRARSTANVLCDPGSRESVDGTYPAVARIYVGDISSQVYDFLDRPRPCVFLNAHGIDWRDDPHFANWHLGDVVDDPAQVMDAIRAAPERHALYRERQERMIADTLGDTSPGASARSAEAIMAFVRRSVSRP
ncbi:hypothetical protein [Novosphingobium colocasiae]|uniref:hypothetical protein n=1 Tax=Novosphingobium colocasiae TaxID=1256513 RepID=UPI0035B3EC49